MSSEAHGISQATVLSQALAGGKPLTTAFPILSLGQSARARSPRSSMCGQRSACNRQIFFAFLGGFDTHDLELTNQATGLDEGEPGNERFLQRHRGNGRQPECGDVHRIGFRAHVPAQRRRDAGNGSRLGKPSLHHGRRREGRRYLRRVPDPGIQGPDDANNRGVWIPHHSSINTAPRWPHGLGPIRRRCFRTWPTSLRRRRRSCSLFRSQRRDGVDAHGVDHGRERGEQGRRQNGERRKRQHGRRR